MEKHEKTSEAAALRQKAEELLKNKPSKHDSQLSELENLKLIFELEVHQIELELQNEELRHAQAVADAAHDKYIRLYDLAPSGYYTLSRKGEIIELNLAGALMLGKDRSHLVNKHFHFFISNDTQEVFNHFLEKLFINNTKESCEVTLTTSGNQPVFVHLSGIATKGGSQCFVTAVDITIRKNAELALRKEAERNSLLLGLFAKATALSDKELYDMALDVAVKITDSKIGFFHQVGDNQQEINLTTWNDEARKNCTTVFDNHYPLDKAGNWADCIRQKKAVVNNDYPASPNKKGLPEGHSPVGRLMSIPVIHDEKVRLIFGVGNKSSDYTDLDVIQIQAVANELYKILEKRKVEKYLQKNEERWQFAIEGSNDGIWDWNIITDDVFFSNRWKEMIGYGPDELEGKLSEWQTRVHPDDIKAVMFKLQQHFGKKTPVYAAEHRIRCKDGSWKWILDRGKVLEWTSEGKPSRMVGTHTNITEQKEAIEEIRWRNDDLQLMNAVTHAANRNESLDSILNIVSDQLHKSFNSHSLSIHLPDGNTGEFLMHSNALDNALVQKIKKLTGRELPQIRLNINSEHPFSEIERTGKGILVTGRQAIVNRLASYLKGTNWPSLVQNLIKKMLPALCNLLEYQSAVAVPMIANGKTIGFLELGSRNIMTDHDLSRIQSIADHFAAVIVRCESEKKLRESEEKFRSIFENMQDAYFEASVDGIILEISPSIEIITKGQYNRHDMIGNPFAGVYSSPEDRKIYYSKLFNQKSVTDYELSVQNKDGSLIPIAVSAVLSYNADGKPAKISGIIRDITERKANETALKKLSQAVQQSPVMVCITDLDGNFEYANPKATELTGYTLEELVGQNPRILNSGEKPKEEYRILWETLKSGKEWRGEFHNKKKNGELFWSAASISPIIDSRGNLTHYLAVQEDITERKIFEKQIKDLNTDLEQKIKERTFQLSETNENLKNEIKNRVQAEAALRESQEQLELVIKGSNDAPWDWNLVTDNLFYSAKWWQQLGYAPDEIPSDSSLWRNFTHYDDKEHVIEILNNALSGNNDGYEAEFRLLHKDGHYVPVLSRGYITRDATGKPIRVTGTNMDLTERKRAEDEMRKARNEAEKANLAKSEFLSRMSHELRTPMNSIIGFAQLMNMGELNPKLKKGVNHILNSGRHLLNLINEILDISGIEAGRVSLSFVPVELGRIIGETVDAVHLSANTMNVNLELINRDPGRLFVKADPHRLRQVLLNLINNAVKYNREGGSVMIKTELQPAIAPAMSFVRISVSDTGCGIIPENIEKLFMPFERIGAEKTGIEGTGLGLMVVKKLMDAMCGRVGVESVPGEGSTFWIELQHSEDQETEAWQAEHRSVLHAMITQKTGTILYVEDNASNTELVEQILLDHRPSIHFMSSTKGAQTVPLAIKYAPDLILLDLDLPDMQGFEVMRLLQAEEKTKTIPVVVVSADAMVHQIEKLMNAGSKDYLTKPLDIMAFLDIVDEWVR